MSVTNINDGHQCQMLKSDISINVKCYSKRQTLMLNFTANVNAKCQIQYRRQTSVLNVSFKHQRRAAKSTSTNNKCHVIC